MIALMTSVLIASLVGSAHCAGMCGGIAAFCGGAGECGSRTSIVASTVYHASRFVSYAIVGALAGAFGVLLNSGGALVGLQQIAAVAAGLAVALVGVSMLIRAGGIDSGRMPLPLWMKRLLSAVHRAAAMMRPTRRALVIGLATPLLPCGWLWTFAAVAAGTGSIVDGLCVMTMFWAGTVPILALVGAGIASLRGNRRRFLVAATGVLMITVGVYTAGSRAPLAALVAARLAETKANISDVPPVCCQEKASQ